MRMILITTALTALMTIPAAASPKADVMASVHQWITAFNKGDTTSFIADCADDAAIVDEFAPYEWHGAGACSHWMNDYAAYQQKNGTSDGKVRLGVPHHVIITGDRAYVIVPASFFFKQKGKMVSETGSMLTLVLHNGASGWRIVASTWSQH